MTPDRFRACLDFIGWSQRSLAARLQMDERQVRRWAAGAAIPEPIAAWLETLARAHERNPPPARERSRQATVRQFICPGCNGVVAVLHGRSIICSCGTKSDVELLEPA